MSEAMKKVHTYSLVEELWHALVHGIGILLSIAALTILVAFSAVHQNVWALVSSAIFGASLVLIYSASTLYHAVQDKKIKKYLKKLDHIAIYYLIAGTYTPFLLTLLRGTIGWTLFGIIWGLAFLGTVLKLVLPANGTKMWSVTLYLSMGWLVLTASHKLFQTIPSSGLLFLVLGGFFYTAGILFYVWKSKKYTHAIWHFFVLLGSIMHFFAVLFGCVLI